MLREALALCRQHAGLWFTAGLMALPMAAVSLASGPLGRWTVIPANLRDGWPSSLSTVVLTVVQLLILVITTGVMTLAVARVVAGRPTATRAAWREGLGPDPPGDHRHLALILPTICWGFLIMALPHGLHLWLKGNHPDLAQAIAYTGTTLFFLFISVRYSSVYGVAMIQRIGGFEAADRAVGLQFRRMGLVAGAVLPIELCRHGLHHLVARLPELAATAGTELVNWALLPIETAAAVLLYVRLRAERDGLTPQALNDQLAS